MANAVRLPFHYRNFVLPNGNSCGLVCRVPITIRDDEAPTVTVTPLAVSVAEGGTVTYTVVLDSAPSADVTVTIDGFSGSDVSVNDATLEFTAVNWNMAQTVTVSAAEDADAVNDTVTLTHTASGGGYGNAAIDGVEVKVVDNDAPMVAASPRAFAIPEGESGTYTLTMTQAPSADVLVRVNLGTTEVVRYEFGTSNWMTVRTVTVNAPHDADHVDDDFTLTHTASGGGYDGVTIDDVVVTVLDDDVPGVTVTPTSLSVVKGEFADYTVALETEPEDDVRIAIDGLSHSLTFTTTNWPNPQTFRVHIPATSLYGILEFTHSASGGGYDDVAVDPVLITIIPAAQLELSSDPGVDENYVTGDVIEVEAAFYTEVTVDTTNGTPSLALTVGNTARQAVYQSIDASNRILTFAYTVVAGDSDGDGVSVAADVLALNGGTIKKHGTSDDASLTNGALTDQSGHRVNTPPRGVTVTPAELSVDEGGSNTYTVVLDTQPSADVTVMIGGFSGTDVSANDSALEFTTGNWNMAQTVTVSAAEDDDPNHDAVTLTHTASGGGYDAVTIDDVEVTVSDNDTIAFTAEILPETDSVEEGETLEVTVRITASMAPEDSLTFRAYTNEGTATLTDDYISFLPSHQEALSADFSSQSDGTYVHEQTFDLETVEDAIAERDETLTFDITEPVYLADANYTSEVAGHEDGAEITIKDDDAGMTVTPTSLSVAEGGSNTYTVVLDAEPSGPVTVTIGGASGTDVSVDDPTLEFTTVNWNMAQTVTVSAAEDADAANDVVTLTHTASGGSYDDVPVAEVEVSVADNDARRVVVAPMQQGVHEGGSNTYTVVLSTEPTDDVTVTIAGFDGTGFSVNDPTLEFTTVDWSTAQTVTVSAAEDDNGVNETVTLTHTASGGDYDDVEVAEVEVSVADNDGRRVVVSPTSLTVNEGGTKTYTVVLSTEPTDEVTVTIGGFSGTSISVHDSMLEFGTGDWDTAQTVTVSAAEDDNGVNETVTLTHTASGGDYADVAVAEVEVSVADNETASTAVALTVSPNSVEETDTATTVTVTGTLNGSPRTSDTTVTVSVGAPGDTATEGVDYARVGDLTLRIDAGETSGTGTFSLDPTADDVGEADEMLSVTGTTTATGLTVTSTTVTIVNKNAQPCFRTSGGDRESVTVSFCSGGSLNATEAGGVLTLSAGVRIQLDRAPRQTLTIPLTVEHRGGATAADYEGWPSSVTFGPDETEKKFIVSAVDDEEDDDEESLVLGFGEPLPEGVSVGEHRRMTILLHDDDGTETWYVSFEEAAYTATEGGAGAEVAVVLSEPWKPWRDQALTVPLYRPERRGGATGADYTGVPDSVTFQPGSTRATFTVRATDDAEDDDGESVLLQFRSGFPEDLKVGNGPRTATVRLADNDGAREVAVRFGAANITAVEGGADAELEVRLSAAPGRQVTVPITASLDGATSADYSGVPGSVTFGSFQTTATFTVRATDDAEDDDHERVTFGFGALPAAVIAGTPSSATLAITDNDGERTTYTVNFDAITGTVRQLREGGSYWLGVSLNKAAEHTIGIPLTVTHLDGATAADYTGLPATVVIEKGERKSGVIVGGVDDTEVDPDELLRVEFGELPHGVRVGDWGRRADFRIIDHDGLPRLSVAGASVREWSNPLSYLKFVVTLDRPVQHEVRVDYATTDGTAVAGEDYEATFGTLVFDEGEDTKNVWVEVCHDGIDEDTERMTLRLSNPERAELRGGATASATGSIRDNRGLGAKPCSTGIVIEDAEAREFPPQYNQDNQMTFEVRLNQAARSPVTVSYRTVDGTAIAGQDYVAVSGVLRFEPGETEKTIAVTVKTDLHDDPGETFTMLLSNPQGAYLGDGEATGTIKNSGPMPGAWLSRFGRVAADQAVQSIGERVREGTRPRQDNQFTLGGRRVDTYFDSFMPRTGDDGAHGRQGGDSVRVDNNSPADSSLAAGSPVAGGSPSAGRSPRIAMPWDGLEAIPTEIGAAPGTFSTGNAWRPPTLRELMMGASFDYSRALDENGEPRPSGWLGEWSSWGRTAATRFAGADGPLSVNGEVATATLGFDSQWDRWIGGVALSYSEGEGAYTHRSATGGAVSSSLTSLMPYASYTLNDRTSVWGTLGYGVGDLTLTPEGASAGIETDLSTALAAFGGRGVLNARVAGIRLAWVSDALLTETSSDTVQGLNGAAGGTSRVRLMLEGSGSVALGGVVLQPRVEAGLRYDGGDAETGAGIELGGGLGYAAGRIAVQVNARGLVAHEDAAYEEWGFSGSVQYRPGKDGRGLTMQLGSAWGATQSGVQSLWARADASGLARTAGFQAAQRFQAELGYGVAGPKGRALWVPFLQGESSDGAQALVLGVRMTSGANISAGLEIGGRAGAGGQIEPAVQLNGSVRW